MYLFDLQAKLKRANKDLFVITDRRVETLHEIPSHPLMLRDGDRHRGFSTVGRHYMDSNTQKFMDMKENGQAGQYVCGVSAFSPEYDILDKEKGTLLVKGWRSLAMFLVKKKLASLDQVRKAFECESLGTTRYDKADYDQKLRWAQE